MKTPVYLDHNATTPVDPAVLQAMLPYFCEIFGNPMSHQHSYGWNARAAVDKAREPVAKILGAEPREIFFTGGATESIHLAILGVLEELAEPSHLITSAAEHKCVLEVCAHAEKLGHQVTYLPVNEFAQVRVEDLRAALQKNTRLVSIMHANNEVGSINPISEIGAICRDRSIYFHVDAAQTVGKVGIDVRAMNIDLLSLSGHKLHAPKGVGALFVRQTQPRVRLQPCLRGGGQEKGLRGGTHNVAGIVGLARACELALQQMPTECPRQRELTRHLLASVTEKVQGVHLNGHPENRLVNNLSLRVEGIAPDILTHELRDLAYSSASACAAGITGISHVLQAMGQKEDPHTATLRFGLGRFTTREEIDFAIETLVRGIQAARQGNRPLAASALGR